ncbi:MAG: hypothetical protein ACT4P5_07570, partial [Armatimonadota bacterium]
MHPRGRILVALVIAATLMVSVRSPVVAQATQTYIVLYKAQTVPAGAATGISQAGGVLVYA